MLDESLLFEDLPEEEQPLLSVSGGDAGSVPYTVIVEPDHSRELELLEQIAGSSGELLAYEKGQDGGTGQLEYLRILTENSDNAELLEALREVSASNQALLESNSRLELQMEAGISILLIFLIVGLLNYIYKFLRMFF